MKFHHRTLLAAATLLASCAGLLGCSGGPGRAAFEGQLLDNTGAPVADAIVTIAGIQAQGLTDAEGRFVVIGAPGEGCTVFTASAAGYSNAVGTIDLGASHSKRLARCILPGKPRADFAMMRVNPPAPPLPRPSDVVLLIDRSTLPASEAAHDADGQDLQSLLQTELEVARQLADRVHRNGGRVGIVARDRESTVRLEPSVDLASVLTSLDSIRGNGPAAWPAGDLVAATDMLIAAGQREFTDPQSGIEGRLDPPKIIVMFSGGEQMSPVQPPAGSRQERLGRNATLAAGQYAADHGVSVVGIQIRSDVALDERHTTLPTLQAMTGVRGEVLTISPDEAQPLEAVFNRALQRSDFLRWISADPAHATTWSGRPALH